MYKDTHNFIVKQGKLATNWANKTNKDIKIGNILQILDSNMDLSKAGIKNLTMVVSKKI